MENTASLFVSQRELKTALATVKSAIANKSTLPVLTFVKLTSSADEKLELTGTNLEIAISTRIHAGTMGGNFSICLPGKTLFDLIGTLSDDEITLTLNPKTFVVDVKAGKTKSSIKGIASEEFPPIPAKVNDNWIDMSPSVISCFSEVAMSASGDESRAVLTGVHVFVKREKVVLESSDGFRASRFLFAYGGRPESAIIPERNSKIIAACFPGGCKMSILESVVVFDNGNTRVVSQKIDGQYPELDVIIPKYGDNECVTIVNKKAFLSAIKRAVIFSKEENSSVVFEVSDSNIDVRGASEIGNTQSMIDLVSGSRGASKFVLNYAYVQGAVNNIQDDEVYILSGLPTQPIIVTNRDKTRLHIIMPMLM